MSLQTLHADLTEKAIIKENRTLASTYREGRPTATPFRTPEGYGRVVNPRTDQQSD